MANKYGDFSSYVPPACCTFVCDEANACDDAICTTRYQLSATTDRMCFDVGMLTRCGPAPNPGNWELRIRKKGSTTDILSYPGFSIDLNGFVCFVLDDLILSELDTAKRYVGDIYHCGVKCGCTELYFEPCYAELAVVTFANGRGCGVTNPAPTCAQKTIEEDCATLTVTNVPCT